MSSSTGNPAGMVPPSKLAVLGREAPLVLRRRQQAEDLLDRARDARRVVDDLLPLVGMRREEHDGVADELGDRLGAGAAEERGEAGDLLVVEAGLDAVAAVDGHLGEPGEHVVDRVARASRRQLVEVAGHLEHGRHARRASAPCRPARGAA